MRWLTSSLVLALVLVSGHELMAQSANGTVPQEGFSASRFLPAPGGENYLSVDGAQVAGELVPSAGLVLDYAHRPFVLFDADCEAGGTSDCTLGESEKDLVAYQFGIDPMGSITFAERFQVGLVMPLAYSDGESFNAMIGDHPLNLTGGTAFAMGDPRLSGKVRIVGEGNEGVFLAGLVFVTAPLGEATAEGRFMGHGGVTGGLNAVAEFRYSRVRFAYNMGGNFRENKQFLSTEVGSEMTYGVGASVSATPLFDVLGELAGSTAFSSRIDENPMEARLAGKLRISDFVVSLGGGAGLISGVGVPNFRVVAGASWQPSAVDSDGDTIPDTEDSCPTEDEDLDGYLDEDGCPDEDNDGDGLPDAADRCPDEREDADGYQDNDGCKDIDNDDDGVPDGFDSCPNDAEDKDGDRDEDGCPDHDTDQDGINDDKDKCPNEPEDTDGFGDEDGCPEDDFDGDGVADDEDECPEQPENVDGVEDQDGCPEEEPAAE